MTQLKKLLLSILVTVLIAFIISSYLNTSLPFTSCGGSTLRGLANKCVPGFSCVSFDNCLGCGGICLP